METNLTREEIEITILAIAEKLANNIIIKNEQEQEKLRLIMSKLTEKNLEK